MTSEEVAKLWEAFQMFDEDGNSTISAEELGQEPHCKSCCKRVIGKASRKRVWLHKITSTIWSRL
ncbi:MAG: hypothetical protein KME31_07990 [Tolypothrix carrinoi HA7290-LM1]|nr:hypothetical protein [Tolypothrix carrinoi HA7290-LM1]